MSRNGKIEGDQEPKQNNQVANQNLTDVSMSTVEIKISSFLEILNSEGDRIN
jgi:hypothetical protein